ncbi:N-carbamoyl-L-amino acid amidohydrolase [Parvularcula bermudensis HTCC2503]|uniref:N-carbamoyl-L-amino acid amidohydrolase n=1 Tax=Parvularcula bermudensis (strain ATCC BAA-594 / HTCC2503 / KCTC 12087) TaxID=314260 RepID=E0TCW5_PARBH|nr:allantoate amidohydrolase [Parvularcula bermudensis]ADM10348.1 N-carbamoyl-L-amino acid amidohydrolase [Parvularcula bermudensis HTCC2503]
MVTAHPAPSSAQRAIARCRALERAPYSEEDQGLFRPYLSPAHATSLGAVASFMQEAGMTPRLDAMGNLIGRYEGAGREDRVLMIGSHIDSVRAAGVFDGPLGVMIGIEAVHQMHDANHQCPFPIEIVAFGDEEGSRFHTSMLCSRAVAGDLADVDLDKIKDADGVTVRTARTLFRPPLPFDPKAPPDSAERQDLLAFVEVHIEQGPALEAAGLALGSVSGIAAQRRLRVHVGGKAGHAGTVPMSLRTDALTAAAEIVLAVEDLAAIQAERAQCHCVATVGRLEIRPGASNVIPGAAELTIDIRAETTELRDDLTARIAAAIERIADRRQVSASHETVQDLPGTACDPDLTERLSAAIVSVTGQDLQLSSGAGHDAMVMARACPIAMMFVRCRGGISHHPDEYVEEADVAAAITALGQLLSDLEHRHAA